MRERLTVWIRCRLLGLHAYDWQAVFDTAGLYGELHGRCMDCGREGWPE
jgi:hypothetical protein